MNGHGTVFCCGGVLFIWNKSAWFHFIIFFVVVGLFFSTNTKNGIKGRFHIDENQRCVHAPLLESRRE